MEDKLKKAAKQSAVVLNERAGQQAKDAPVDSAAPGTPTRRTWEGYAADYHALSERLVEVSHAQQDALAQVKMLEDALDAKDGDLRRVKAQRLRDLERLAAVSRTRDLLEKRSSAQMAKVAAAMARSNVVPAAVAPVPTPLPAPTAPQAEIAFHAHHEIANESLAALLEQPDDKALGFAERRWWTATVKAGQQSHRSGRLGDAQAAFELALRTRQTASLWEQLAHVLREGNRFTDAELAYRRSLGMRPGKAELMFLSGYCLEMAGRPHDAIAHYEQALAGEPALADRYDHLRDFRARLAR